MSVSWNMAREKITSLSSGTLTPFLKGITGHFPLLVARCTRGGLYGRGALDDKGPILAALYSLKAIRDSHVPLGKRIRVIFGTDEETGDMDIAHYLQQEKPPICGFTPDAEFPVVFAEKGILHVNLTRTFSSDCQYSGDDLLISLNGGDSSQYGAGQG